MDFSTPTLDLIKHDINKAQVVNSDQILYNRIKESGDSKAQLQKAAEEFESVFITKLLNQMDKTVDKTGSIFGDKSPYVDAFKGIVYQQIAHDMAANPRTSIGLANQIYKQMERYVG